MSPAFSSTRQAAAFAGLLLVLLLLPLLLGKSWLPPREEIYGTMWWRNGPNPYLQQQIFNESEPIDIAFVGSSHILHGIDTPHVQAQLSEHLGRPAVVRTLGWGGAGFDVLYFIARDLLEQRKVRLLVFYDEYHGHNNPNQQVTSWFRWGDHKEVLPGLPWQQKLQYYFASVLGMPRNLLSLVRPNLRTELISARKNYQETHYQAPNPAARLGSMAAELGFSWDHRVNNTNFAACTPDTSARSGDAVVYSSATANQFHFSGAKTPGWQLHFARKLGTLAREHDTRLVLLHIPTVDEVREPKIVEDEFWPDLLGSELAMVGLPPAKMFAGLSDADVQNLFFNPGHLNANGLKYFTPLITPSLLRLYDSQTNR